jgi:hypothetical protein
MLAVQTKAQATPEWLVSLQPCFLPFFHRPLPTALRVSGMQVRA